MRDPSNVPRDLIAKNRSQRTTQRSTGYHWTERSGTVADSPLPPRIDSSPNTSGRHPSDPRDEYPEQVYDDRFKYNEIFSILDFFQALPFTFVYCGTVVHCTPLSAHKHSLLLERIRDALRVLVFFGRRYWLLKRVPPLPGTGQTIEYVSDQSFPVSWWFHWLPACG